MGERIGSWYLSRMKIMSFGTFSNRVIGPFKPHLNVVHGKNEAGKTTLNAFATGVLFGWEDARGTKNTYKPSNAERAGSLFFTDEETDEEIELSRVKNVDGLQGPSELLDDIDKETFLTMFALTSDELRSLRNTTDVTAKLLTAGSGTEASPAQALDEIQGRIGEYTSRAAGAEHSITQLTARQDELRAEIAQAGEEVERFKHQDKEFHDIAPQREALNASLQKLNAEIEKLSAGKAALERLDDELSRTLDRRDVLLEEEQALVSEHRLHEQEVDPALASIAPTEEHSLRDRIDTLSEEQSKRQHSVDLAKDNYTDSKSNYEALLEAPDLKELEERARRQRHVQIALSVALPVLFVCAGVPVFMHGREITSLSFTALGIILVVFALFLAGAALVMLFRPTKTEEALNQRKQDAQWVMLQDKKKLEACEEGLRAQKMQTSAFLDRSGLGAAQGSLRRARTLLDEAKDARAASSLFVQKQQALVAQLSSVEERLADIHGQKEALQSRLGLSPDATMSDIETLIEQKAHQRSGLIETSENVNRRFGELKQELAHAKRIKRFDALKLEYQQVTTRLADSEKDLARLLLARHMLEAAITAWESKSQPEVYRQASRLLETMTAGAWVQVRMSEEGRLQVVDQVKTVREPVHLSLGTCQQLYLSLRIALLMTAENVGRAIPIMADDILVNFDEDRRRGAASALKELAARRQVILFTCHEEIVRLMQDADSELNLVEL
ncbi:ATP-binding protein [Raoultibacter phocaeensis]|uniref:ATP-binding protein n=1 Tax=Raoultibacter phocaeensis TaxID=2479841 RepID=UPI0021081A82|nr:AAA family ATPase [Raoultibacter phocaeensis]